MRKNVLDEGQTMMSIISREAPDRKQPDLFLSDNTWHFIVTEESDMMKMVGDSWLQYGLNKNHRNSSLSRMTALVE
ncbi:hypothetical protein NECAME_00935 [Necator americanus]|uniref:Uncharacterized protein n=1 Tax=Necator americanus TaxID=51031 RepID=W2SQX2_NECAM|nr:hypothetical protein NECAME_00935 [Necator americanus]ETN71246.1 hypothetical protein NECAME_00935 [Necator americanus]